jgi:hypothetical protein
VALSRPDESRARLRAAGLQESVTLAMLDDVHAKWASIGHDDDLIIMRWSAWETFVLCPLVPGKQQAVCFGKQRAPWCAAARRP